MQPVYDQLATSNTPSNRGVQEYLDSLYAQHERIFTFMCSYKHHEDKSCNHSNRNQANDFIARVVIRRTNTDEPYKLAHTSTKKQRKKEVQKALSTKAIVVPTDEFRTSVFCCKCLRRNQQRFPGNPLVCAHRKKMRRIPAGRSRQDGTQNTKSVRLCLDDEGNYAHRTSQCPIRARPRGVYLIYVLELCQQYPENNGEDILWNRDANGGFNMRTILTRYIVSNFDLASRPLEISRVRQGQQDDEA